LENVEVNKETLTMRTMQEATTMSEPTTCCHETPPITVARASSGAAANPIPKRLRKLLVNLPRVISMGRRELRKRSGRVPFSRSLEMQPEQMSGPSRRIP
jgi:hypothetical protein